MTQSGTLWQPRGVGCEWGGRFKKEGRYIYIYIYVKLWLICIVLWQKPIQPYKPIILQLKKKIISKVNYTYEAYIIPRRSLNKSKFKENVEKIQYEKYMKNILGTFNLSLGLRWKWGHAPSISPQHNTSIYISRRILAWMNHGYNRVKPKTDLTSIFQTLEARNVNSHIKILSFLRGTPWQSSD